MTIETAHLISYSPTRTTFKTLEAIAQGMGVPNTRILDLTPPPKGSDPAVTIDHGIALIGVPVYAGRIAPMAARRLKAVRGDKTPAVVVVVYGNRHYEDALMELKQLAEASGFVVVAGAALVGEHSYSSTEKPIAQGRPDADDRRAAQEFGTNLMAKINGVRELSSLPALELPGTSPQGPYPGPANITPETDPALCTLCGQCAECCPTGAITLGESLTTNAALCTFCCACLKACPENAMSITTPKLLEKIDFLYRHCQERREPELFL